MRIRTPSQDQLPDGDKSESGLEHAAQSNATIAAFFVVAFAWSWVMGFAATQIKSQSIVTGTVLLMVSGFGPSIAAPISRSLARAGITCRRSSMITRVTSSRGNCARRCGGRASPAHWNWHYGPQAAIRWMSCTNRACYPTTAQAMSLANWLNILLTKTCAMFAVRRSIRKPRVRLSTGTRP